MAYFVLKGHGFSTPSENWQADICWMTLKPFLGG
jgi:hypothetical protein